MAAEEAKAAPGTMADPLANAVLENDEGKVIELLQARILKSRVVASLLLRVRGCFERNGAAMAALMGSSILDTHVGSVIPAALDPDQFSLTPPTATTTAADDGFNAGGGTTVTAFSDGAAATSGAGSGAGTGVGSADDGFGGDSGKRGSIPSSGGPAGNAEEATGKADGAGEGEGEGEGEGGDTVAEVMAATKRVPTVSVRSRHTIGGTPSVEQIRELQDDVLGAADQAFGISLVEYAVRNDLHHALRALLRFYRADEKGQDLVAICAVEQQKAAFAHVIGKAHYAMFDMLLNARSGFKVFARNELVEWVRRVKPDLAISAGRADPQTGEKAEHSLLYCVCSHRVELTPMVHSLINAKARSQFGKNSDEPLHVASWRGHTDIVGLLLEEGAHHDARNKFGQTALHLAFRYGNAGTARRLMASGASMRAHDVYGRTPVHYAFEEHLRISKLKQMGRKTLKRMEAEELSKTPAPMPPPSPWGSAVNTAVPDDDRLALFLSVLGIRGELLRGKGPLELFRRQQVKQQLKLAEAAKKLHKPVPLDEHGRPPLDTYVRFFMGFWKDQLCPPHQHVDRATQMGFVEEALYRLNTESGNIDSVMDLALEAGAELDTKDHLGQPCFSKEAKEAWYQEVKEDLASAAWSNIGSAYNSPLFEDKRTQAAVQHQWQKTIQSQVYIRLAAWALFVVFLMWMAVWQTGRNAFYVRLFQSSVEEALLFDEADEHHTGFVDIRNTGDFYNWVNEVLVPNVYSDPGMVRLDDEHRHGVDHAFRDGAIGSFNLMIGRPRFRMIRSLPLSPCPFDAEPLNNFHNSTCFSTVGHSAVDKRNFTTGNLQWVYHEPDVPTFTGLVETYSGGGHDMLFHNNASLFLKEMKTAQENGWVDMHTRLVIFEMALFNPGQNLYLVARLAVEFVAGGAVVPTHRISTLPLVPYNSGRDILRAVLEIIAAVCMLWYIIQEFLSMFQPWPLLEGQERVPTYQVRLWRITCSRKQPVNRSVRDITMDPAEANPADMKPQRPLCCRWLDMRLVHDEEPWDSGIELRPYFYEAFNVIDSLLIMTFTTLFVLTGVTIMMATRVPWNDTTSFVNVFTLASVLKAKIYMLATVVAIVWIKTLQYMRVNRSLSIFILIIKGMLVKLSAFAMVLFVCLCAFTSFEYIAFGARLDDQSFLALSLLHAFDDALGNLELLKNYDAARYVAPLFSMAFAIFILILLFNLLIAVMSEAYEALKEKADAVWCFTQFRMIDERERALQFSKRCCHRCRPDRRVSPSAA